MTEEQIKRMVSRFLAWKLPADFSPDGGVSFDSEPYYVGRYQMRYEPYGTNLLNAAQAEEMVRFLMGDDGEPTN